MTSQDSYLPSKNAPNVDGLTGSNDRKTPDSALREQGVKDAAMCLFASLDLNGHTREGVERAAAAAIRAYLAPQPEQPALGAVGEQWQYRNTDGEWINVRKGELRWLKDINATLRTVPAVGEGAEPVVFANGPVSTTPEKFLSWIADRLIHIHGENPQFDYMLRLREMARGASTSPPPSPDVAALQAELSLMRDTLEMNDAAWRSLEEEANASIAALQAENERLTRERDEWRLSSKMWRLPF